ncbi:hypothetical protein P691DRAFT_575886 [Macrolepiota fuliginosa MF-IS2]|uniref:Uncharacterized protein n=1 Tax=Macrolepiota fuliginosa MF-IS2 TaxID=1400762 RepID=A0A9P6C245_9AGAR|nr:hypothetical protein P691DRAFT_575886 [Macrolepiota fuliginosa MF-IS2]
MNRTTRQTSINGPIVPRKISRNARPRSFHLTTRERGVGSDRVIKPWKLQRLSPREVVGADADHPLTT